MATESSGIFKWSSLSGSNNRLLNTQLDSYKCPFGTSWQAKKIWKKEKLMETSQNDEVTIKKVERLPKNNKTRTRKNRVHAKVLNLLLLKHDQIRGINGMYALSPLTCNVTWNITFSAFTAESTSQ